MRLGRPGARQTQPAEGAAMQTEEGREVHGLTAGIALVRGQRELL